MSDYLRGIALMLIVAGVALGIVLPAPPAGALPSITATEFAMWPADYCAKGSGSWDTVSGGGGTHVTLTVVTTSLRAPSGTCNTPSTATAGTFAAWGKVEKQTSGVWAVCKSGPWAGNATGEYEVASEDPDLLLGCGSGNYRLRSENRITYGGTNQYSPPFFSSSVAL